MSRTDEEGSASLWVVGAMLLVLVTAVAALAVGGAVVARHRADSAADLAALAAAARIGTGGDPCAAAARLATANNADLQRCEADVRPDGRSGSVRVWVVIHVRLPVVGSRDAHGRARAGRGDVG